MRRGFGVIPPEELFINHWNSLPSYEKQALLLIRGYRVQSEGNFECWLSVIDVEAVWILPARSKGKGGKSCRGLKDIPKLLVWIH